MGRGMSGADSPILPSRNKKIAKTLAVEIMNCGRQIVTGNMPQIHPEK